MTTPRKYSAQQFDTPIDLDLSQNEGSPGRSDLLSTLGEPTELLRRYPDTSCLRRRLAELHELTDEQVLLTAGGDDALLRCFMARTGPARQVLTTQPTFEMIQRYAEQVGASTCETLWRSGPFPTEAVLASAGETTDIAFLVSPNNPTGAVATESDLQELAARIPFVVLDAAYGEFTDADLTAVALTLDNVVVVRTLSKAYGLAGLRVGYLLGDAEVIAEISSYGSPYPVSGLSAAVALARLERPQAELDEFLNEVRRERAELSEILRNLGCEPLPSHANFVLADCADPEQLVSGCAALGVGLRRFAGRPGLENAVRITLPGDSAEFGRLTKTLAAVLAPAIDSER